MADVAVIYRVAGDPPGQGWFHVMPHPLRRIPAGQGMGTYCQTTLGWPQKNIDAGVLAELVQNFGQGPDFI